MYTGCKMVASETNILVDFSEGRGREGSSKVFLKFKPMLCELWEFSHKHKHTYTHVHTYPDIWTPLSNLQLFYTGLPVHHFQQASLFRQPV